MTGRAAKRDDLGEPLRGTVVIFAKAPRLGEVKTRLAATIGDEAALELYRTLLVRTTERLRGGRWRLVLAVTPDESARDDSLWPEGVARCPQGEGDLGARMVRILGKTKVGTPVVLVGSDIPELNVRHVEAAFEKLRRDELVFGPARDGGFYLVGASSPPRPALFEGVRWSCEHTLSDVLAGLDREPALIETLDDLDDAEALARHRAAGSLL